MTIQTDPLLLRTWNTATEQESIQLHQLSQQDPWKPRFHIHPQFGLINDPNGLAYYNGEYHAFYQWFPFDAAHGMKHWAHAKSKDLAHWERMDVAITPLEPYEKNGAYSGASLEVDGKLILYYTGNVKYDDGGRSANQCAAIMTPDGKIEKLAHNPLIEGVPDGYTGHIRDPKVFRKNDRFYMFLGAQRSNETGTILVYESSDALHWTLKGELHVPIDDHIVGYMWECPDYYELDGKDVLVFCPQGVDPSGCDFHNIYNVVYVLGTLDIERLSFDIECCREVDKGFDFYAPQSFAGAEGQRLMFGWAGLPEIATPSDRMKWSQCLTLPRVMRVADGKLLQQPAPQLHALRGARAEASGSLHASSAAIDNAHNCYELELQLRHIDCDAFTIELFAAASGEEALKLQIDRVNDVVTLDRSQTVEPFALEYGTTRCEHLITGDSLTVTIYVDRSIAEIFINGGEAVFTTRFFPQPGSTGITLSAEGKLDYNVTKYELEQGIEL